MALWIVISFLVGLAGALLVAQCGHDWGLMDPPNNRSSHRIPVPKGGGLGILIAFIASAIYFRLALIILIPVSLVSLISLLGDYQEIPYKLRLAIQMGSAALISGSVFIGRIELEEMEVLSFLFLIIGIIFITATANYFNFMDGIDGIAGLTGIIAFSSYGIFGIIEGKNGTMVGVAFCVAAACLGFLPVNFPKAKVFMGDVGSILLGFLFASLVLCSSRSLIEFILFSSFILPFYFDEISTLISRLKDGDRLTKAHRRHIYQILANQAGMSHTAVAVMYGVVQIISIMLVWLVKEKGVILLISVIFLLFAIYYFVGLCIRNRWEGGKINI